MANVTLSRFQAEYEALRNEFQICRQKLDSKCEALLILSKDLDQCRQERDQFKLMAEQVQERYQALKRQLAGVGPRQPNALDGMTYTHKSSQNLAHLLCEMREVNKSLQFEVDDLKQKLNDAQGDIKVLREQIARQRLGSVDEGINTRHFPAYEREDLVKQLEEAREQYVQLERDLQQVLDEKEELVTERDVYKTKFDRLNTELNYILKGDENRIVDIDALSMENKYLQERLKQMEEEKCIAMATVSKYKSILERKKNKGILKLGQSRSGGVVITQRQVQQLLENKAHQATPQMMSDLQSLAAALFDTVNDKNLALSHQRKTNKILGTRVSELEKKLKTLEVSGLWSLPGAAPSLEKLKLECEEIKTLIPKQASHSSDENQSGNTTPAVSPGDTPKHATNPPAQNAGLSLADLDLLPTKENPGSDRAAGFDSLDDLDPLSPKQDQYISDFKNAGDSFSSHGIHDNSSRQDQHNNMTDYPQNDDDYGETHDVFHDDYDEDEEGGRDEDQCHDTGSSIGDVAPELESLLENATNKVTGNNPIHTIVKDTEDSIEPAEKGSKDASPTESPQCTSPLLGDLLGDQES